MTENPFEPTYSLEAANTKRSRAWLGLRKLLVLMVLMAALPLALVELINNDEEQRLLVERARSWMPWARVSRATRRPGWSGSGSFCLRCRLRTQ